MFNKFNEDTKKVIAYAKREMMKLRHPYLGSEHIMLGILSHDNNISNILKKYGITYKKYKDNIIKLLGVGEEKINYVLYTPIVKEIFERAIDISEEQNSFVSIDNLFVALIELGDGIAYRILKSLKLDIEKLYTEILFKIPKKNTRKKTILDEIGVEYTDKNTSNSFEPVIGRDNEIKQIIEILIRKNKSNPLIVGAAGVGKTAIVEEISKMIIDDKVPNKLKGKRIINIDMSLAVAGTKYRGEFEEKLNKIIKEAENDKDIILFIDEIHTIVGAGGAEGAIDASNIFKPALARGKIKCIGATTIEEYKKYIEKDKALERRFKKVLIEEPDINKVKQIIRKIKPIYENYHHVKIEKEVLELIIDLTNRYIHNYNNPDKTIDILDEVCAHANLKENKYMIEYNALTSHLIDITKDKNQCIGNKDFKKALQYKQKENEITTRLNNLELILSTTKYNKVTKSDVLYVLKNKVNIPIINNSREKNLKKLQSTVIGQNNSIEKLYDSYVYNKDTEDCISILLNGPSGVGKTFLATEFSKIINYKLIRIDMGEYTDSTSINRLIGVPIGYIGYDDNNYVFDKVKQYPFSVILLDEIEKANKSIINLFSQILENNKITDSKGNEIRFDNTIIIMTTNIKNNNLGFNDTNKSILNNYFPNDFLKKITNIIELNKLKREDIIKIINKSIAKVNKCKLNDKFMTNEILNQLKYEENGVKQLKKLLNSTINHKKLKKIVKNYSKN